MHKADGMVPGIYGLLQGERWPRGTTPPAQSIGFRLKLDSFQASGFKELCEVTSDKAASLPYSPATTYCPMPSPWEQSHQGDIGRLQDLRETTVEPSSALQAFESLQMPKCALVARGGWLDTHNWLFDRLWREVCDKSLEELHDIYFSRDVRPEYGGTHAMTRKGPHQSDDEDEDVLPRTNRDISRRNHGQQERDRRQRHRFFQKEFDDRTPTSTFEIARKILPEVRTEVKRILADLADDPDNGSSVGGPSRRNRAAASTSKVAGKDDQLLAAVLTQDLASIVVCREHDARITAQKHLSIAEGQVRQLGVENKHLLDEIAYLHRCHMNDEQSRSESSASFTQPQLPPPTTTLKRKRIMDDVKPSMDSEPYMPSPRQPAKRQHFNIEQTDRPVHGYNRTLLPPSPTPSCDGGSSSFRSL